MIKPIETHYNGYRFRSRLEARWAIFFDTMGIEYRYEPEGFTLGKLGSYLPDCWLPHSIWGLAQEGWGMWAEMKPIPATEEQMDKLVALVKATGHNALIFQGYPWPGEYTVTKISGTEMWPPTIWDDLTFTESPEAGGIHLETITPCKFTSFPWAFRGEAELQNAYNISRQARFEYGERGIR